MYACLSSPVPLGWGCYHLGQQALNETLLPYSGQLCPGAFRACLSVYPRRKSICIVEERRWAGNEACFVTQLPHFRSTCLRDAAGIPLRSKLERTSIRTELATAILGFQGIGVVLFVETLKAVFNRVILCLRSRIGFSNYVNYNTQTRKTTIHKDLAI